MCTIIDTLTRGLLNVVNRARTMPECINALRTIVNTMRETADEIEALEAKAKGRAGVTKHG